MARSFPFMCLCLLGMSRLLSQEAPSPAKEGLDSTFLALLDTPVIAASKRTQWAMESPQAVEVFTGEQLLAMGVHRLTDALRMLTNLDILDQDGMMTRVSWRGLTSGGQPKGTQVLVDGVPLYFSLGGAIDLDLLPLPLDAIERVEVVRGASSSLYGANAQFGVIAITSRRASDGRSAEARVARATTNTWRGSGTFRVGGTQGGLLVAAGGFSMGDNGVPNHQVGRGVPVDFENSLHGAVLYLRPEWRWGSGSAWAAFGHHEKRGNPYPLPALPVPARILQVTGQVARIQTFQAGLGQALGTTLRLEAKFNATDIGWDVGRAAVLNPAVFAYLKSIFGPTFGEGGTLYENRNREVTAQFNWDPGSAFHLVGGADARRFTADPSPVVGFNQKLRESAAGAFLSGDWNAGEWTLSVGLRAENETMGGARTSPRAALLWGAGPRSLLRLAYTTSSRSPALVDRYIDTHLPGAVSLPNPEIRPERVTEFEAGWRLSLHGWSLDATAYWIRLRDYIELTVTPGGQQYQNVLAAHNLGLECTLSGLVLPGWSLGLNAAYVDFPDERTHTQFAYAPRFRATLWNRVTFGRASAHLALHYLSEATLVDGTFRERRPGALQGQGHLAYTLRPGLSLGVYAMNAARPTTPTSNNDRVLPSFVRTARREVGLQVSVRY